MTNGNEGVTREVSAESIYNALPGVPVAVDAVQDALAAMWEGDPGAGRGEPAEFRASQMNVIIHFGRETGVREALETFSGALRFAQRYPCRIVVLCPEETEDPEALITLKMFAECYVGKTGREKSCCEALILAYPHAGREFLNNQVSILLENDLPTYYWFHHFAAARNVNAFLPVMKTCKRVVYDSALETPDAREIRWPHPERVRDLAYARLLPVRQSIGQFLGGFDPALLARGIASAEVRHPPGLKAEAGLLAEWFRTRLDTCARLAGARTAPSVTIRNAEPGADFPFQLRCDYDDNRYFQWQADLNKNNALIRANLDRGDISLPMSTYLLPLEKALGEAFFF